MKLYTLAIFILISFTGISQKLDSVTYMIDGESYTSYYALPSKISGKTKTILIVHEWWGLNDYPKMRAIQLAKEGMIGFCIDMYGTGKVADNPKDAQAMATPFYQDSDMAYKHFLAGLTEAINIEGVQEDEITAIGYCFGGSMVLNAARKGAPIAAVVSFHGGLAGDPVDANAITLPAILICHGAADQFVSETEVQNFKDEMAKYQIEYTFISYPEATHAFTNPGSTAVGEKFSIPIAYNKAADKKSWIDFKKFVKENVN